MIIRLLRNRQGQGMVEYALLVAGVACVCMVGVSMMGHKTSDMISTVASILPGSHSDDNGPIIASQLIETQFDPTTGDVTLNNTAIASNNRSLNANLGIEGPLGEFVDDSATVDPKTGAGSP